MMKKLLNLSLTILFLGCAYASSAQITYTYDGTTPTYTIPPATFSVSVDVQGACGGGNGYLASGGQGARITGQLSVTPGEVLYINVGGVGGSGGFFTYGLGGPTGPFTGGGDGAAYSFDGSGGGGGATDIRVGGTGLANRIIAAGAGGGAGYDCGDDNGGDAGLAGVAGDGLDCSFYSPTSCGSGATPTTAGAAATLGGFPGGPLTGGSGVSAYSFQAGGGGGGGYYGGGGGFSGGGGGGSSYVDLSSVSSLTYALNCTTDGNGYVTITPCTLDAGTIVGPSIICLHSTTTLTDPTGVTGGTWSSANSGIASVNSTTGAVTGVALGSTTITYTINLYCGTTYTTAPVTIISTPSPITGPDSVCAGLGPDTLADATGGGTWSSSNPSIAAIGSAGDITTFTAGGVVTITYSDGSCSVTRGFTVNPNPAPIAGPTTVCKFDSIALSDALPGGVWTSTVPGAATVGSSSGIVTGRASGATDIVYTSRYGCVSPPFIVNITIPALPITGPHVVCQGSAIVLNDLVTGGTWATSSSTAAPVSTGGVVTAILPGVVNISYTTTACPTQNYPVTINPLPSIITGPTTICIGYVTVLSDSATGGVWSSSNPEIVISPVGDVTSDSLGAISTITYTLPTSCNVSTVVNVNNGPGGITGPDSICVGATATFTDPTAGGTWTTTDLAIADIVDTSGVIGGVSGGNVIISYTLPSGCNATKLFTVNPLLAGSVSIVSGLTGIICDGTPDTLTALPVNGGTPTYLWEVFSDTGRTHSDTASSFVDISVHGDVIMLFMMPHNICALHDTVGDTLALNVYPYNTAPIVSITTSSDTIVTYLGEAVTFFSNVTWAGAAPAYQWYVNGSAIPGATNTSYEALVYTDGTYTCQVTGYAPCDTTLPLTPGVSNGITIHANYLGVHTTALSANDLSLLPNPNNGTFILRGTVSTVNEVNYEVTDVLGRTILSGKTTPKNGAIEQQINIGDVASGTYLLQVITDSGNETFHFVVGK